MYIFSEVWYTDQGKPHQTVSINWNPYVICSVFYSLSHDVAPYSLALTIMANCISDFISRHTAIGTPTLNQKNV